VWGRVGGMPKDRHGQMQVTTWLSADLIHEIDKRVSEIQLADPLTKVHRSDVVREIIEKWIAQRRDEVLK
jgi:metal-responsive CopG/Arc/MetJ family transcriptional regulator